MSNILVKKARLLAVALVSSVCALSANAISFSFTQDGFAEGATVSGSFSGADADNNGFLDHSPLSGVAELSSFYLNFSGNSIVPAFSMALNDLQFFSFQLGGDMELGNDFGGSILGLEGLYAENSLASFAAGVGTFGINGGSVLDLVNYGYDETTSNIVTEPKAESVPDGSSTLACATFALFSLLFIRRRLFE